MAHVNAGVNARHIREMTPNRLAGVPKPAGDSYHLRIVAEQQTAIAFHVLRDRGHPVCRIFGTRDATTMCDDLMPTPHEQCRVIGANVVAHEKQDFHLSLPAQTVLFFASDGYSTLGKSGQRAPHWSFVLCPDFFGQSAVMSSSQSMSLASRPRSLIRCCTW